MLSHRTPFLQKKMIQSYRTILTSHILRKILMVYYPELGSIAEFVKRSADSLKAGSLVLDAGAGSQNYKVFFSSHIYESTDFCQTPKVFEDQDQLDFTCDLRSIPKPDNTYDALLNVQVLEHIPEPEKALSEMFRVLKRGGKLFIVVPQGWWLHDEPHHYFNFTKYGIETLLKKCGFKIISLKPRGGFFWNISTRLIELPFYALNAMRKPKTTFPAFLLFLISAPIVWVMSPPIFFILDYFFDESKKDTLGYECVCVKI